MIVIAIIGILAAVAVPQYSTYTKRARYSEVVLATTAFKTPAEIAVQTGRISAADELDAATGHSPDGHDVGGPVVSGVDMTDGQIVATVPPPWTTRPTRWWATITNGGIRWAEDDTAATSCQKLGLC